MKTSGAADAARRPLENMRVLVLRPEGQAEALAAFLAEEGAVAVSVPAVRILPPEDWREVDRALSYPGGFDWLVFTSVNGVRWYLHRAKASGKPIRQTQWVAAIGPSTKKALEDQGVPVRWTPTAFTTGALAAELPRRARGRAGTETARTRAGRPSVCLIRADIATPELDDALAARGFDVQRVNAYRTEAVHAAEISAALAGVDAVIFTSASSVDSFAKAAGSDLQPELRVFSIGPATSAACRRHGIPVHVEAGEHTIGGLLKAIRGTEWGSEARP